MKKYLVSYREVRKSFLIILIIFCLQFSTLIFSQGQPFEIKIWPDGAPGNLRHNENELIENRNINQNEFGLNRSFSFVSDPTLTIHLPPKELSNGIAVLIFPGGGYNRIVIDKEGHDIARKLNSIGITGIVVKYRTAPKGVKARGANANLEIQKIILSDALEAMKIVKSKAKDWNIDPNKIGVMGFSAGGHLSALMSLKSILEKPFFTALIYPALEDDFDNVSFNNFPHTFIVSASDDATAPTEKCIKFYQSLKKEKISAELHIYNKGGHGFGLGVDGGEVVSWMNLFINWLKFF